MRNIILILAILFLFSCSVRYAQRVPGFVPGYIDQQLGENTYQVKIGEAWQKDWPDLEKFAMYRAAEITKSRGQRYFVIQNASTQISKYIINTPSTTTTSGTVQVSGNTAYMNTVSTTSGGGSSTISGGWYTLDFKIITNNEVPNYKQVVDADIVMTDLKYFIDSRR